MRAPPRSRISWNCLKKYSKNLATPLGLVKTSQSYELRERRASTTSSPAGGRFEADGGRLEDLCPELLQAAGQLAGLFEGARDDDPPPEERPLLEPVELPAQLHHFANDGHGRRADLPFGGNLGDGAEGSGYGMLAPGRAPLDHRNGRGGVHAVGDQHRGELPDTVGAHHDDFGAGCPGHLGPINGGFLFGRVLVSRNQGQPRAKRPVRERHARISGHGHEGGNPRHNLKGYARIGQLLGLLAASAKNIRVAPFEPDHGVAGARLGNEQFIEFLLGDGLVPAPLAAEDDLCRPGGQPQQLRVYQRVVDHHVRPGQQLRSAHRQQPGVPRPCAYQIDRAFCFHWPPLYIIANGRERA